MADPIEDFTKEALKSGTFTPTDPLLELINRTGYEPAVVERRTVVPTKITPADPGAGMIIDNKPAPTSLDPRIREAQKDLPPLEQAPQAIQVFVKSLKGLDDLDKLQRIHDFVNDRIKYKYDDLHQVDAPTLLTCTEGDCKERSSLALVLAEYAGFEKENLYSLGGRFDYKVGDKDLPPAGHRVAIVKSGETFYMLDMNLKDVYPLGDNLKVEGMLTQGPVDAQGKRQPVPTEVTISPTGIYKFGGNPDGFHYPKADEALERMMEQENAPNPPAPLPAPGDTDPPMQVPIRNPAP